MKVGERVSVEQRDRECAFYFKRFLGMYVFACQCDLSSQCGQPRGNQRPAQLLA
jgi:hypothetical protein